MNESIQIIRSPKGEELVVLTRRAYERLRDKTGRKESKREAKEDAADLRAARKILSRIRSGKERMIPHQVVKSIIAGTHPVRAWRDERGLTAANLAERVGVARAFITQIETGAREASMATLRKLAKALDVPVAQLVKQE
jgi:DNA-binding XRE family transcriptional regulator